MTSLSADAGPQGLGFLLGRAHRARRRAWEAVLADLGLTAPQAAVLRAIAANPGVGVRALARIVLTDPMNVQRVVEALDAAGLCTSRRDPNDARRRPLHPTAAGRRVAATVAERARRTEQQLAEVLGAEHYRALLTGLQRLVDHDEQADAAADQPAASGSTPAAFQ